MGAIVLNTFTSNPVVESTLIKLADDTERFRASARSNWVSLKTGVYRNGMKFNSTEGKCMYLGTNNKNSINAVFGLKCLGR